MDSALKQRLIGAAVLVALGVIFLPMLLQGPAPDDGASDVPLQMPEAPDVEFETRELPLIAPMPGAPESSATGGLDSNDPNRVATVDAGGTPAPRMDAPVEPLPAPAPSPPSREPIPAAQSGGRYVVNLGIYANRANASALVDSLKKAGLPAYSENTVSGGRAAQRVRLGPFDQRSAAEAARLHARDVRVEVPASVVALDTATPAPASTPSTSAATTSMSTGYAVQVGAFRTEGDANALRERLRAGGFGALTERVNAESGTLFRVRVGPTAQRAEADRLRAQVAERFKLDGLVVSYP